MHSVRSEVIPVIPRRLTAIAILVAALALRCLALGRSSLGNDEIEEVRWARLPVGQMLVEVFRDGAHPPLDFLVQSVLTRLGAAEWMRRLPSVLAGTAGIGLLLFLAGRWFGSRAGLAAGLLLCVSPIHVRYSQEVRPYALGLLFLTAAVAALEAYREKPGRGLAAAWFLSVLAAMYTLYFAGLLAILVGVCLVFVERRGPLGALWRRMPMILTGWLLGYLPWLASVVTVARKSPPMPGERLDAAWWIEHLQVLGTGDWKVEPLSLGSILFWLLVVVGLTRVRTSRPALVAASWLLLGGLAQIVVMQLRPHYPAVRHFLPSWLGAVLLASCAISVLVRFAAGRWTAVLALCAIAVYDARTLVEYYDHGRPRWDAVAAFLRDQVRPGEHVVAVNGWAFRNLGYYWTDERQGAPGVALERARTAVAGPAWLVVANCPVWPELEQTVGALEVRATFSMTNHCTVRYLPSGAAPEIPRGVCENGF
ncbi:MAG TPA: glycosyltransferase family 39 protein [Thermoanaerobaculia bacterium]